MAGILLKVETEEIVEENSPLADTLASAGASTTLGDVEIKLAVATLAATLAEKERYTRAKIMAM